MKKLLIILGGIFAIILILFLVVFGYASIVGPRLDRESKAWVDDLVPKIVTRWDANILAENSSAELLKVSSKEEFLRTFAILSDELGTMEKYKGSQGEAG